MFWDLTTERVLTMEFMEGGKVDDREYMERHHIATHEVDVHTHGHTNSHHKHSYIHTHKHINPEREGGREGGGMEERMDRGREGGRGKTRVRRCTLHTHAYICGTQSQE